MCMVDSANGFVTVLTEPRMVKARKVHLCDECCRFIQAGEHYERGSHIWEDELNTTRVCRQCRVARKWLVSRCGGWVYGGVQQDIREHAQEWAETPDGWWLALTEELMKRRWLGGLAPALPPPPLLRG